MRLEVGKTYVTRDEYHRVFIFEQRDGAWPFKGRFLPLEGEATIGESSWREDGTYAFAPETLDNWDLMEITPAGVPFNHAARARALMAWNNECKRMEQLSSALCATLDLAPPSGATEELKVRFRLGLQELVSDYYADSRKHLYQEYNLLCEKD